ncbi:MAG: hypothetical protein HY738_11220, partial [Bacteroidia bacterium]|nr:hypothetical protein [Bacteroidia bacterium]
MIALAVAVSLVCPCAAIPPAYALAPKSMFEHGAGAETSLIDTDDIDSGRRLVETVARTRAAGAPQQENHTEYTRLLISGEEILTAYQPYLNTGGLNTLEQFKVLRTKA